MSRAFFKVNSRCSGEGDETIFSVSLLPESDIFKGHFPEFPVLPGVCSVGMVRDCASLLAGCPLRIAAIRKCRFIALITPDAVPDLDVSLKLSPAENGLVCYGALRREGTDYVKIVMDLVYA